MTSAVSIPKRDFDIIRDLLRTIPGRDSTYRRRGVHGECHGDDPAQTRVTSEVARKLPEGSFSNVRSEAVRILRTEIDRVELLVAVVGCTALPLVAVADSWLAAQDGPTAIDKPRFLLDFDE